MNSLLNDAGRQLENRSAIAAVTAVNVMRMVIVIVGYFCVFAHE
jgi:hypothetical protein